VRVGTAEVWTPDEQTRVLRRRISRRAQLVRQRTREKNQVHAIQIGNLKQRSPATDLFGAVGRAGWPLRSCRPTSGRWMRPACAGSSSSTVKSWRSSGRSPSFVLASNELRRLLTLPGVNFVTACALLAAIGDVRGFPSARHLVSYLGLTRRCAVGSEPARHGRISKQGPGKTRHVLVEAAWTRRAPLDRCAPSTNGSPCWHMLSAARTTPSPAPRSCARSCVGSSSRPAPSVARASATRSASSRPETSTGSTRNSPSRPSAPTAASSRTGSPPSTRAPVPHRGARPVGRQAAKQRGRRQPHLLRFSTRSPAPTALSQRRRPRPAT
jgi:Transposase IS116/IS110/IS902 family